MKIKLLISAAAFFLIISDLSAGTHYNAEITGFSGDGRYAALKVSAIEDGSGFYYLSVRLLDVFRNRFVSPEFSGRQKDDEPEENVKKRVYRKAGSCFRKYRIGSSINLQPLKLEGTELEKSFNYNNKNYSIKITETDSDIKCNSMAGLFPAKGYSISLNEKILDKVISPGGKLGCSYHYIIDSAFSFKGHVIIIYRALTPGFEGPDSTPLFSSATLE